MKHFYTAIICTIYLLISLKATSQATLFSEDFNGAGHDFELNTSDFGGATNGSNLWVVNNSYNGGLVNIMCPGIPIPLPATPGATPNQPGGITGGPQSRYMHITSIDGEMQGVNNCHFNASNGFCAFDESYFARMSTSLNTVGFTNVTLSFWWICAGGAESFGEAYYSTDGGTSWTIIPGQYLNGSNWQQQTITNVNFDNQPNLRFAFRFVNLLTFAAEDPAFGLDDILVTGGQASNNTITTGTVLAGPFCPGETIDIPFTVDGTFNAGNVFTAQLSNGAGTFAAPVAIGTLNGTTNGVITATIPPGTAPGTGYRVRVISSSPSVTGTPSDVLITVAGPPSAAIATSSSTNACSGGTATLNFQGGTGTIQWSSSTNGTTFNPIPGANSGTFTTPPLNQTTFYQVSVTSNCGSSTSATWTVTVTETVEIPLNYSPNSLNLCNGPVTISITGTFLGLEWSNGQTGTSAIVVSSPAAISVSGTDVSGCEALSETLNFIETEAPPLVINPQSPVTICGNSATLTASAGFTTYAWSNGASGNSINVSSPGTFTVTATDANGCVVTALAAQVVTGSAVIVPVSPSLAAICEGIPATLTANPGFTGYSWSNGANGQIITVDQVGFYSVTATDANGCPGVSAQIQVIQSQFPISNFSYAQTNGYTVTFNNTAQNGLDYLWLFDTLGTSPLMDPSFTFPESGVYEISLITGNPCDTDTIVKTIVVVQVGIAEIVQQYDMKFYPNPFQDQLFIQMTAFSPAELTLELYDITGRMIQAQKNKIHGNHSSTFDTGGLPAGIYFIRVTDNIKSTAIKIVKR